MIKKVQINNYFQLAKLEQKLEKINLLSGSNNTGKTTFCDAVFFATNGFSQLHYDSAKIKNNNRFCQVVCFLDETTLHHKTIKVYLEKYKSFFCDNEIIKYGKCLEILPLFFVSSQTLSFNKFHQQSRFFYKHIVKYNPKYQATTTLINQQFRNWLQIRNKEPADMPKVLEIEKNMTNNLHLIWEEHNNFVEEINKNIVYLCQQFFPQFSCFFIKLISWLKKTSQKNATNIQKMITDFWVQKRKDQDFRTINQVPVVNDFIKFDFSDHTRIVNPSWSSKNLMKLILNLAIAWFVKHQNKKIVFVLDGFDFLDEQYRLKILKILTYFDQILITTTNTSLWPLSKFWNTEENYLIAFPLKQTNEFTKTTS